MLPPVLPQVALERAGVDLSTPGSVGAGQLADTHQAAFGVAPTVNCRSGWAGWQCAVWAEAGGLCGRLSTPLLPLRGARHRPPPEDACPRPLPPLLPCSMLYEVFTCFGPDLQPIDCPMSGCRDSSVLELPDGTVPLPAACAARRR